MSYEQISDRIMEMARDCGAKYPMIGESSDGNIVIVDEDSGDVYAVTVAVLR